MRLDRRSALRLAAALPLGALSRASSAQESVLELDVTGELFAIRKLAKDTEAFCNRTYALTRLPDAFREWQYTRIPGGVTARLTVQGQTDGFVYIATGAEGTALVPDGWEPVPDLELAYDARGGTALYVYRHRYSAGDQLSIPQHGWSGAMVLAPKLAGESAVAAPDFSQVPGTVVGHRPAYLGGHIASPSIALLTTDDYVASATVSAPGRRRYTAVYRSPDRGATWLQTAELDGIHWASLFEHRGALYLMGMLETEDGPRMVAIARSEDSGDTWTVPVDDNTGRLLSGQDYSTGATAVVVHNGRVWRAMEDCGGSPDEWPCHFRAFLMSAPEDADLLEASNWTCSQRVPSSRQWLEGKFRGWLEGNAVVGPDGAMLDAIRVDFRPDGEKAALIHVAADGVTASFDPRRDIVDFPGGCTQFVVRRDPVTGHYCSLANWVPPWEKGQNAAYVRNTLALTTSPDLRTWTVQCVVLYHPDRERHGFHYVDWQFDGDDIAALSRTACDDGVGGAQRQHDANLITFHRFRGFRHLGPDDSCPAFLAALEENR